MSASHTSMTVVSAPGKVLLTGGYVVLDRLYSGMVIATSSRFYSIVTDASAPLQNRGTQHPSQTTLAVRAGQFPRSASTWIYEISLPSADSGPFGSELPTLGVRQVNGDDGDNKFVQIAVAETVRYACERLAEERRRMGGEGGAGKELLRRLRGNGAGLEVVVLADNDFYSHGEQLAESSLSIRKSSLSSLPPFCPLPSPIAQTNKTGLGSSAALVTSLVASLLQHLQIVSLPTPPQSEALHSAAPHFHTAPTNGSVPHWKHHSMPCLAQIHALAQYVHCLAQGKIGSGFDVSSAVFGSHVYRRFSPSILEPLMSDPDAELLPTLDPDRWDQETRPVRLPRGVRVMLADVDAGTDTPSFVGKVLKWREREGEAALRLWTELDGANRRLGHVLDDLVGCEGEQGYEESMKMAAGRPIGEVNNSASIPKLLSLARSSLLTIRQHLHTMSQASDVPIEPPEQTRLLDACSALPGVIGGGVPGAGGYDAIFLLVIDQPDVTERVDELWSAWKEMSVCPLLARQSDGGLRLEDERSVPGLREALDRR